MIGVRIAVSCLLAKLLGTKTNNNIVHYNPRQRDELAQSFVIFKG